MAPVRLRGLVCLCAAPLTIALSLPATASADTPSWNGQYAITFMVGPKSGTSMAAGDPRCGTPRPMGFARAGRTESASPRSSAALRRATRLFRNRFNSPGMARPGRKSAISSGTA